MEVGPWYSAHIVTSYHLFQSKIQLVPMTVTPYVTWFLDFSYYCSHLSSYSLTSSTATL